MSTALQRFLAWTVIACLPFVIAACGGGGGSGGGSVGTGTTTNLSVTALKGPVQGALIQVYQLLPDGRTGDLLGSGISDASGTYPFTIPALRANGPLLVKVTGRSGASYTSETTGGIIPFKAGESFSAVTGSVTGGQNIIVSPLTDAACQKLQQMLTINPALATEGRIAGAIIEANNRVASLLNVGSILSDPAGDPSYRAALLIIDQMIVTLGPQADTLTVMNLINQAYDDVTKPAYQVYQQALTLAAARVANANPTLAAVIQAIVNRVANPAPEPDWTDIQAPTAPSGLSASTAAVTANTSSIILSWNPSNDNKSVTGYDIYRDGSRIATVTLPGYTDPSLANNATYTYLIMAFDSAGNRSIASGQLLVPLGLTPIDSTPPTAPPNLSASTFVINATSASVVLMWVPSTDNKAVAGYDVFRGGIKTATVTMPGYTDPLVDIGTAYSYYIVAFDGAGNRSASSGQLSVTPNQPSLGVIVNGQLSPGIIGLPQADVSQPTAPTSLSASTFAQTATTSSIVLSWSPATDNTAVTGYEVYRNGVRIATVSLPGYTDPSVTSAVAYNYFVMAFDAAGNRSIASNQLLVTPNQASLGVTVNGQLSPDITGLPQLDVSAPAAPSNLTASTAATSATTSSVLLSWSPSTDDRAVTGYEVYRNGTKIATVALLGYNDAQVASNTPYIYFIMAFDAAGNRSIASNQLAVTPSQASLGVTVNGQLSSDITGLPLLDVTPPTAPSSLSASTTATSATTSSVLLVWSPSVDDRAVTGYDVYRNGSKVATVNLLGYTDFSVASGTAVSYHVTAFDAAGNRSTASAALSVTPNQASLGVTVSGQLSPGIIGLPLPDVSAPTAPSNLSATTAAITATTSSVLLAWSPSSDNTAVTGYDVFRDGSKIATVSIPVYTDQPVANATYTYHVVAFDAAGNRSLSSIPRSVTPSPAVLSVTVSGQLSSSILGF